MKDEELLKDLYYVKHNYDSAPVLYQKAKVEQPKITLKFVSEWLKKQQPQQLNKEIKNDSAFDLPIYSDSPNAYQVDLTFLPKFKKQNDGYDILFTAINIISKLAFLDITKDKTGENILFFVKSMLDVTPIDSITCDYGKEFKNKNFISFCNQHKIKLYFVNDESHDKLGIINRFHRTIKDKLKKYFTANNTVRWIDVIFDIVDNYNHTINSSIGQSPLSVNSYDAIRIIKSKELQTDLIRQAKPDQTMTGKLCRIKIHKKLFADKSSSNYSYEIYRITSSSPNSVIVESVDNNLIVKSVKKSDIQIIHDTTEKINLNEKEAVIKNSTIDRRLRKSGVDVDNILTTKRNNEPQKYF